MTAQASRQQEESAPRVEAIAAALVGGSRPSRPSPLSSSISFGWRALLKIKHVPEQLADVTLFPVIMTLLFTFLFGGAIAGSVDSYIAYIAPGVLVQSVLFITMYSASTLRTDIDRGVFDRFRSLPIWRPSPLIGMLLGDAVRYSLGAAVTAAVCLLIGWRPEGGFLGVLAGVGVVLTFAFGLGWLWLFFGLILRTPGSVTAVSTIVLMPVLFGSNIFVDPSTMPGWLQGWVEINPVSDLVTTTRAFMNGTPVGPELGVTLAWSAGLVAVFGSLTMWRYRNPR
ncbi:ABC transporter permease [Demequina sp. SYSU T00192]|uniref:Transport permease protein n=1 Tax=Demequina litoralis TaxID=3051660 RepID=A0ABT8GCQ6_9MICO|nr:ABC transporter permease [Demequina sp. SYSU T00192]MDN4476927.1 ABC transporter permease [Demequina sp. SYSU T00192]